MYTSYALSKVKLHWRLNILEYMKWINKLINPHDISGGDDIATNTKFAIIMKAEGSTPS
jgi:hypothetical protein